MEESRTREVKVHFMLPWEQSEVNCTQVKRYVLFSANSQLTRVCVIIPVKSQQMGSQRATSAFKSCKKLHRGSNPQKNSLNQARAKGSDSERKPKRKRVHKVTQNLKKKKHGNLMKIQKICQRVWMQNPFLKL